MSVYGRSGKGFNQFPFDQLINWGYLSIGWSVLMVSLSTGFRMINWFPFDQLSVFQNLPLCELTELCLFMDVLVKALTSFHLIN